jgi:hypothetical protein
LSYVTSSSTRLAAALPLVLLGAFACSLSPSSDLAVNAVSPSQTEEGTGVDVTITGSGFDLDVSRSVSCGGTAIDLGDGYGAALGDTALVDVTWMGEGELTASVPADLAAGRYDLTVTKPSGDSFVLPDAFEVTAADVDSDTDTDTDSDADSDSDSDSDTDTDTDSDSDTDTGSDSESDAGMDAGADAGADAGPEDNPLVGMVFVQAAGVGVASYHFDAIDDISINYSNAPGTWHLDDLSPFPDEKPFTDTSFDLAQRAFYGTIDWSSPEGTTANGAERWVYEMLFSDDYGTIEGGSVKMYDASDVLLDEQFYGTDLFYTAL